MTGLEPATYAMISAAVTVVGTAVSMYGQMQQGNAAADAAEYDAQLRENEAQAILNAREANKQLEHKQHIIALGRDKNAAGSSGAQGFDDIFIDDIYTYESSALIADYNASIGQYNKKGEAASTRFEGQMLKAKSRTDALSTGLQGASRVSGYMGQAAAAKPTTLCGSVPVRETVQGYDGLSGH